MLPELNTSPIFEAKPLILRLNKDNHNKRSNKKQNHVVFNNRIIGLSSKENDSFIQNQS